MGLFDSPEQKQAKQREKVDRAMSQYGLQGLTGTDRDIAFKILEQLGSGSGLIEFGTLLQGNGVDGTKLNYLKVLVQQNWLIIRQLAEISNKLNK